MRLQGKTALIAGDSRNIGRAIALTFAREGANVVAVARTMGDELRQVARECEAFGVQALPVAADVSDREQVNRAALFLASDESSFITGDRMICAGGRYM